MSVTLTIVDSDNRDLGTEVRLEPCYCTQLAPCFTDALDRGVEACRDALAAAAEPECGICAGSGVDSVELPGGQWMVNLANATAPAVLGLLGVSAEYGRLDLAAARRAIVVGARKLEALEAVAGSSRPDAGIRTMTSRGRAGARVVEAELTLDGLRTRFLRVVDLVSRGAEAGGVALVWS